MQTTLADVPADRYAAFAMPRFDPTSSAAPSALVTTAAFAVFATFAVHGCASGVDDSLRGACTGACPGSSPQAFADEVNPLCVDGQYSETLPDVAVDLSAAKAAFQPQQWRDFLDEALALRYADGAYLTTHGVAENKNMDCVATFLSAGKRGSTAGIIGGLATVVHECGHLLDNARGGFFDSVYVLRADLSVATVGAAYQGDGKPAGQHPSFARSRLLGDEFVAARPPCPKKGTHGCDGYASVYLSGDPANAVFESGDQGLDSLLEETVQYVHSLATEYAFRDRLGSVSVSARDGILTFLWYLERFLYMARTEHAEFYAWLVGDEAWRTAILTVWGQAWWYLAASADIDGLGLQDDSIIELVRTPLLLNEIELIRLAHACH